MRDSEKAPTFRAQLAPPSRQKQPQYGFELLHAETSSDPVGDGFVASLPGPGGNTTGFISQEATMAGKVRLGYVRLSPSCPFRLLHTCLLFPASEALPPPSDTALLIRAPSGL
jgi:hypothetical protein